MTATMAIQSGPSKTIQSADNSVKSASEKNNSETSEFEIEQKSSFKNLYDDAKKVDNQAKNEATNHEVNNAGGNKELAEDGKKLPSGDEIAAAKESDASVNENPVNVDEDTGQGFFSAQQASILNMDELLVKPGIATDKSDSSKSQSVLTAVEKQQLETVSNLNDLERSKLNIAIDAQTLKLNMNDKSLNQVPVIAPGANAKSLAERLSLTKAGDGLVNSAGNNVGSSDALSLTSAKLTDDLLMGDMDKAFNKGLTSEKLSLDAMLGKLDTLTNTTVAGHKQSGAIPLSTALNYAPTSLAPESLSVNQAAITETLGKPEWNQSMSKQIAWMASQNIRSAEIKLTPANLGTIEVRVEMNDDKLNIAFSSRDAGVREMVEQTMPKLREMMEEQGLDMGDTEVSEQDLFEKQEDSFLQQDNFARAINGETGLSDAGSENIEREMMQAVKTPMSAVDYYI